MTATVTEFAAAEKIKLQPMLVELLEAFTAVFPDERLQSVEIDPQVGRMVFTVTSDKLTRTYLHDPARSISDVFLNTPQIDTSKVFG